MALVMTVFALAVGAALAGTGALAWNARQGPRVRAIAAGLPFLLCLTLAVYLGAKVWYEELYPCWYVDEMYCDFGSTQYRNLFGWEF